MRTAATTSKPSIVWLAGGEAVIVDRDHGGDIYLCAGGVPQKLTRAEALQVAGLLSRAARTEGNV